MEVAAAPERRLLLPLEPQDPSSRSSSASSSSAGSPSHHRPHHVPPSPRPRPVPRTIDTTPFPTTFVQADTSSFKQVVQMLTGSDMPPSSLRPTATKGHHGRQPGAAPCRQKKPPFKLYERRSGLRNLKTIAPLAMAAAAAAAARTSPREAPELLLSPSVLDFPSLALSPVTPLSSDPFNRSASASPGEEEAAAERAAIARKGFFLHPSPRGAEPPRLLPLFPVTSPRMASSGAAAVGVTDRPGNA